MARARRLQAPGSIIHITARTNGRQPWFTESLRTRVATEIAMAATPSGHRLIAYAIMPNHFHIIVRQGVKPLDHLMHRVMHRSSVLLRSAHKLEGHIFERRYWSGVCLDADYARAAIVYVHLNPYRARLCKQVADYEWSSHARYLTCDFSEEGSPCAQLGLRLFANGDDSTAVRQYLHYIEYQVALDAGSQNGQYPALAPPKPCHTGDRYWLDQFAPAAAAFNKPRAAISMYDVATQLLLRLDSCCPLDLVRSGTRAPRVSAIRKQLIAALLARGFRGTLIARFFGISTTAVSRVAVSLTT